jgi:hypothetical protein
MSHSSPLERIDLFHVLIRFALISVLGVFLFACGSEDSPAARDGTGGNPPPGPSTPTDPPDPTDPTDPPDPPDTAGLLYIDRTFVLDGRPIAQFGLRAANAMQDDAILDGFIAALDMLKLQGLESVAVSMQGGRYTEGGNSSMNAYSADGSIKPEFATRLTRLLDEAAARDMVVVVMMFYRGRDQELEDAAAVKNAVEQTTALTIPWRNAWFHVINEPGHSGYDQEILTSSSGQVEIYQLIKSIDPQRITHVSTTDGANDGFHSGTSGRRVEHVESAGNVIIEYVHEDSFDNPGVFTSSERSTAVDRARANHANGAYWFWHAGWHQKADEPGWPRWDAGGTGTSDDPGVSFIFDEMKTLTGAD